MKRLGLHLYMHQSYGLSEKAFRDVVDTLYIPIFRTLKNSKIGNFSLSITLATLEQLDKCNYKNLLQDIKDLVDSDRLELVPCPAYNASISNTNAEFILNQIILNEYALGYYFGMRHGFEGEPAILVRDISSCFYPKFDVTEEFLNLVQGVGYELFQNPNNIISLSNILLAESKTLPKSANIDEMISSIMISSATQNIELNDEVPVQYSYISLDTLFAKNKDMAYRFARLIDKTNDASIELVRMSVVANTYADESLDRTLSLKDTVGMLNSTITHSNTCWIDSSALTEETDTRVFLSTSLNSLIAIYEKARSLHKQSENVMGKENIPFWFPSYTSEDPVLNINIQLNRLSDDLYLAGNNLKNDDLKKFYLSAISELIKSLDADELLVGISKISN